MLAAYASAVGQGNLFVVGSPKDPDELEVFAADTRFFLT
jgi:hypothetical protein